MKHPRMAMDHRRQPCRRQPCRRLAAPLLIFLLLAGCATSPVPDLGDVYNKVARHHDQHRNPIIVIPGILGSKLVEPASGRTVWGAFGGGAANPKRPEDARLFALPMAEGKALADLRDEVVPDGVLDKINVRFLGLPLQLKAYFQILLTLGVGGYRDEDVRIPGIDYGSDHFTCFQFAYDWRRDNVENARLLHEFIEEKAAYVAAERQKRWGESGEVKFDVIAHSMGGLLLRYYLRYGAADLPRGDAGPTWAGAERVDRAVLVAPPNGGALDALDNLVEGRQFGPMMPRYESAMVGTFPSLYQLLPRARHGALVDPDDPGSSLDPLDVEVWTERGWGLADPDQDRILEVLLPTITDAEERRRVALDHLEKSLERARRFQAALDRPSRPPATTRLHLMAGDATLTPRTSTARGGKTVTLSEAPGDGTVLRSSALMDERLDGKWRPALRSPIYWTDVNFLFTDHLGITKDPAFTDNVLYLLLESPRDSEL